MGIRSIVNLEFRMISGSRGMLDFKVKHFIGRQDGMVCSKIKFEISSENDETKIDWESLTVDMLVFAFDFDSGATLLGYPK